MPQEGVVMIERNGFFLNHNFMHNVTDLDAAQLDCSPLNPNSTFKWFISETPQQIMPLINRKDASIPTSFYPFLHNFQGLMRNAWGNRNTIK